MFNNEQKKHEAQSLLHPSSQAPTGKLLQHPENMVTKQLQFTAISDPPREEPHED